MPVCIRNFYEFTPTKLSHRDQAKVVVGSPRRQAVIMCFGLLDAYIGHASNTEWGVLTSPAEETYVNVPSRYSCAVSCMW